MDVPTICVSFLALYYLTAASTSRREHWSSASISSKGFHPLIVLNKSVNVNKVLYYVAFPGYMYTCVTRFFKQ